MRKCFRVVIRKKRRRLNDDDVRQISCSPNDARRTINQLSAVLHKLTHRYRRNILDESGLHPNGKIHRSDVLGGTAGRSNDLVHPDIEGAHHKNPKTRSGVGRREIGYNNGPRSFLPGRNHQHDLTGIERLGFQTIRLKVGNLDCLGTEWLSLGMSGVIDQISGQILQYHCHS